MLIRFGFLEFRAGNPPVIFLTAVLPRIVLQTVFWVVLGRVAGGPAGSKYAFVGAVVISLTLQTISQMTDPPITDKYAGTYGGLLRGVTTPVTGYLCRSVASWVFGLVEMLGCWVFAGLLTGNLRTALDMLPAMPVVLVVSLTMSATGIACAAFCVGKRAEVGIYNLMTYLVIAGSNALIPRGKLPALDAIGTVLPATHGLVAIRAITARQPWQLTSVLAEIGVGAGWLVVAIMLHLYQAARARRTGTDAYS